MAEIFDPFAPPKAKVFDPFAVKEQEQTKPSFLNDVATGAKGTAAAIGDFASGIMKIPAAAALAIGGKIYDPHLSTQQHWEAAQQAMEDTFPSFGKDMKDNLGYTAPLKPFELYGEGANWIAKKASMGNPDVEGAINIGANFLPIPFIGKGVKGVGKVLETIDPGLRNAGKPPSKFATKIQENLAKVPQPEGMAPDKAPMAPEGDLFRRQAQQTELPLDNSVETIADMQRYRNDPNQLDLFGDNSGGQRMAHDAEGIKLQEEATQASRMAQAARTAEEHTAALERYRIAQNALEARQEQMRQDVAKQTSLDQNAAERARQGNATTGLSEWQVNKAAEEAAATHDFLNRAQQHEIDATPHGEVPAQFGSTLEHGRVDENGMPIRADLSIEAQNMQDPLQRNLWGDELAGKSQDGSVGMTQALDTMPPGPARDAAVSNLSGQPVNPAALTDAITSKVNGNPRRLPTRNGGSQGGAIHGSVIDNLYGFGKSVIRGVDGALQAVYHGRTKFYNGEFKPENKNIKTASNQPNDLGSWFSSTPEGTDTFAGARTGVSGGHVQQVYLNLTNPKVFETHPEFKAWFDAQVAEGKTTNAIRRQMLKEGFDGIQIDKSTTDGGGLRQDFVAFKKEQIKNTWSPGKEYTSTLDPAYGQSNRSQRGGASGDFLTFGMGKHLEALHDNLVKRFSKDGDSAPPEDHLNKLMGVKNTADEVVTRPLTAESLLAKVQTESDGPKLLENWQSGLPMASEKGTSTLVRNSAQHLTWAWRKGLYLVKNTIRPLETTMSKLSKDELQGLHQTMQSEMMERAKYTPEQLTEAGFTPKMLDAYQKVRDNFNVALEVQNDWRTKNGQEPIKAQDAYMSSVFNGDYHVPVYDKSGKLAWYIQVPTRGAAKDAIKWLKNEYQGHESIDVSGLKYDQKTMYHPSSNNYAVPRDMMGAWADLVKALGNDPEAQSLQAAMKQWQDNAGIKFLRQDLHQVETKQNIRGFEGDHPWLSDDQNAHNWAKAQIHYLNNSMRWAPMQEAMHNIKQYLTDPTIIEKQPNNIAITRAYLLNHMGIVDNLASKLESYFAGVLGRSSRASQESINLLKSATYLATLTGSPGYALATPGQALHSTLAWFQNERKAGRLETLNPKEFLESMGDALGHETRLHETKDPFYSKALKWAQDNSVINSEIFDEHSDIGAHPVMSRLQKISSLSISRPDQFTRTHVFLPIAKALSKGGMGDTAAFTRAAEITDTIMVPMRRQERPLIFSKFGAVGDAAYVFKAPIMNMYNQLSIFGRQAAKGNPVPLLTLLAGIAFIGGVHQVPGINETEKAIDLMKGFVANHFPEHYESVKDIAPREALLSALPEGNTFGQIMNYGAYSAFLNANMSSRFGNELIDIEHPLNGISPIAQEVKEWIEASKAIAHPTSNTIAGALYKAAPGPMARGLMETTMPQFKSMAQPANGNVNYKNPNDLENPETKVQRTPQEERMRALGLTALTETQRREKDFRNNMESKRVKDAMDANLKLTMDAITRDDAPQVHRYASAFMRLGGSGDDLSGAIGTMAEKAGMTPQQFAQAHMNTLAKVMAVARRQKMDTK